MSKIGTKQDKKGNFPIVTGKKRIMAELITSPEFDGNITKACKEVGIARSAFYRWQEDGNYIEYVNWLLEKYKKSAEPIAWRALIEQMKTGNVKAIKLYMELTEKYKPSMKVENSGAVVVIRGEEDV